MPDEKCAEKMHNAMPLTRIRQSVHGKCNRFTGPLLCNGIWSIEVKKSMNISLSTRADLKVHMGISFI